MCGLLHTPLELCGGPYDYCEWETIDSLDMVRSLSAILDAAVALDILVCLRYCAMAVRALHCGQLSLLQPISVLWLSSEDFIAGQNEARRELIQTRQHRKLIPLIFTILCFRGVSFILSTYMQHWKGCGTVLRAMRAALMKASADDLGPLI